MKFGDKTFDVHRLVQDLVSEVDVPNGKSGEWRVKIHPYPVGEKFTVVSARNSIFTGFKPVSIRCGTPGAITELTQNGGRWMSDSPQEVFLHHFAIDAAKGDVLIGGLGLGYSLQKILQKRAVRSVTVVEKSVDVAKLVWPAVRMWANARVPDKSLKLELADLYQFVKHPQKQKFDFCFFDIWCSTGEREYEKSVQPLRKLAKKVLKRGGVVKCWAEEEMEGQRKFHGRGL